MSGAGDRHLHVSTWFRRRDEDGNEWQAWSVRVDQERVGFLLLPPEVGAIDALVRARRAWEPEVEDAEERGA